MNWPAGKGPSPPRRPRARVNWATARFVRRPSPADHPPLGGPIGSWSSVGDGTWTPGPMVTRVKPRCPEMMGRRLLTADRKTS